MHGDYDVDGISAAALMTRWLTSLGGQVVPFVPHRLRDGYDFGAAGLQAARDVGAELIITADCGTAAHRTVEAARAAGIDVIITDHHTVSDSLPNATAVVNPLRPDCTYPNKGLCGTALAYKICELVATAAGKDPEPLVEYLDLVALATVADMVPLCGKPEFSALWSAPFRPYYRSWNTSSPRCHRYFGPGHHRKRDRLCNCTKD